MDAITPEELTSRQLLRRLHISVAVMVVTSILLILFVYSVGIRVGSAGCDGSGSCPRAHRADARRRQKTPGGGVTTRR